jgi:hypothetical protein
MNPSFLPSLDADALGLSLIVGGFASLLTGLVFSFLTNREPSSTERSFDESQKQIEFYLQQIRDQRRDLDSA